MRADATGASSPPFAPLFKLTYGGDQRVGEEHGRHQVPVGGRGLVPEDRHAVLVGLEHVGQQQVEGRGADAALVEQLLLQGFQVARQLLLHRPLDAGEHQRPEQQVDDIEENAARQQQPRPARRTHGWVLLWI